MVPNEFTIVLTPTRTEHPENLDCLNSLVKEGFKFLKVPSVHCVDMARAFLVKTALDNTYSNTDVFLWIDDDIFFDKHHAISMVDNLRNSPYDLLGAVYPTRNLNHKGQRQMVGAFDKSVENVTFFQPGLYPAITLGFGFTAVKRKVFEVMNETYGSYPCGLFGQTRIPTYFSHLIEDGVMLTEDYSFCARARREGFKIGIDAEPRLLHMGKYLYGLEDIAQQVPRVESLIVGLDHSN